MAGTSKNKNVLPVLLLGLAVLAGFIMWSLFINRNALLIPTKQDLAPAAKTVAFPQEIALHSVSGSKEKGVATRNRENNKFIIGLRAELANPEKDKTYFVWLTNGKDIMPLGRMNYAENGDFKGNYVLGYQTESDISTLGT